MLDSRGVGKVSGFHSVKNMPQTSITRNSYTCEVTKTTGSDQMKNRGYKAPDQPGKLTVKTDIYAFGVVSMHFSLIVVMIGVRFILTIVLWVNQNSMKGKG